MSALPEYSVGVDEEGRAFQLVRDHYLDEMRWNSWVESPEGSGYPLTALNLKIVYLP